MKGATDYGYTYDHVYRDSCRPFPCILCTFILIFAMGVMLGKKENFLEELSSLGLSSFLFFLIPAGCSIGAVYFLTKHFMKNDESESCGKELEE